MRCTQGSSEADERLRRVMGEGAQSTERRVFVGGMPFSYEVRSPPTQHAPWHRGEMKALGHHLRAAATWHPLVCSEQLLHAVHLWSWCHKISAMSLQG